MVPCDQIPMSATYQNSGYMMNATAAVDIWESLTNVWDVNSFYGCGYEGTGNGITNHTFGNGTDCGIAWTSAANSLRAASLLLVGITSFLI